MEEQPLGLFNISSKSILVTGASQGIGLTLAEGYARAGAKVYLNGRDVEKLNKIVDRLAQSGLNVKAAPFDVTKSEEIKQGIQAILSESGKIDVLVNNAGIHRRNKLEDLDIEDWEAVIRTNLTAPFMVSKYVVPEMIKTRSGKIINICSVNSELGRNTIGAYAAAKGGLKMLTRNMATEWGGHNIQINGLGPGYIATPMTAELREPGHPLNEYVLSRTPASRWGDPNDLIGSAIFLASSASDFVNGQILYVDGGILATFGNPIER